MIEKNLNCCEDRQAIFLHNSFYFQEMSMGYHKKFFAMFTGCFCLLLFTSISLGRNMPDYMNPALPVEQRVVDLLGRMTLEEKAAQTLCIWKQKDRLFHADGTVNSVGAGELLKNGMGEIARLTLDTCPEDGARRTNAIQKYLMENTRLGIPVIFHEESLHGFMAKGATSFPQAIALASTWDLKLVGEVFGAAALEAALAAPVTC
jgi:beta-glucosidase